MNATYVAIGVALVAIGLALLVPSKAAPATPNEGNLANGWRTAGSLFIVSGLIFLVLGLLSMVS